MEFVWIHEDNNVQIMVTVHGNLNIETKVYRVHVHEQNRYDFNLLHSWMPYEVS